METLDFKKKQKNLWTVILPDKDGTTINIKRPSKWLGEKMSNWRNSLNEEEKSEDIIERTYDLVLCILNNNLENKEISQELVEKELTYDDVLSIAAYYEAFTMENVAVKN